MVNKSIKRTLTVLVLTTGLFGGFYLFRSRSFANNGDKLALPSTPITNTSVSEQKEIQLPKGVDNAETFNGISRMFGTFDNNTFASQLSKLSGLVKDNSDNNFYLTLIVTNDKIVDYLVHNKIKVEIIDFSNDKKLASISSKIASFYDKDNNTIVLNGVHGNPNSFYYQLAYVIANNNKGTDALENYESLKKNHLDFSNLK